MSVRREAHGWTFERGDFRAQRDPTARRGRIQQTPNPYSMDSVLRIVHTLVLAGQGGFLVHAASAVRNGKAFVFSGVSGAGRLPFRGWPADAAVLTDEISYVRREGDITALTARLSPGSWRAWEKCVRADRNIFLLAQGPENKIEDVDKAQAARELLTQHFIFRRRSGIGASGFRIGVRFCQPCGGKKAHICTGRKSLGDDRLSESKQYVARSKEIAARRLGGETMIMSGRDSTLYTLNEVATVIWEAADGIRRWKKS